MWRIAELSQTCGGFRVAPVVGISHIDRARTCYAEIFAFRNPSTRRSKSLGFLYGRTRRCHSIEKFGSILMTSAQAGRASAILPRCDGAGVPGATKLKPQKLAALDAVAEFK